MVLVDCGTMRQSQANYHVLSSVKTHRMSLRHPMVSMALKTVFQDITNHSDRCSWWCLVLKTELAGVKSGRAYFTCFHNFLIIIPGLLSDRRNERPCTVWAPIWAKKLWDVRHHSTLLFAKHLCGLGEKFLRIPLYFSPNF